MYVDEMWENLEKEKELSSNEKLCKDKHVGLPLFYFEDIK